MRTLQEKIHITATKYRDAGLSVIPIKADGSKAPLGHRLPDGQWTPYQKRIANDDELHSFFCDSVDVAGIGIVGGEVSGNLEILDIDDFVLAAPYRKKLNELAPGLYERLLRVKTPRPGMHLYYRVPGRAKSGKLARKQFTVDGTRKIKTLIEIKGEGGYVVAPGSPGCCHPTGRKYLLSKKSSMQAIPLLSQAEHESVLDAARAFNEISPVKPKPRIPKPKTHLSLSNKPWNLFNRQATWEEILEPHGWRAVKTTSSGEVCWRHPEATANYSAVTGSGNDQSVERLRVFSPNTVFEPVELDKDCLLYTSPSPRDRTRSRMPSSA